MAWYFDHLVYTSRDCFQRERLGTAFPKLFQQWERRFQERNGPLVSFVALFVYKKHPVCIQNSPIWDPKSKFFSWGGAKPLLQILLQWGKKHPLPTPYSFGPFSASVLAPLFANHGVPITVWFTHLFLQETVHAYMLSVPIHQLPPTQRNIYEPHAAFSRRISADKVKKTKLLAARCWTIIRYSWGFYRRHHHHHWCNSFEMRSLLTHSLTAARNRLWVVAPSMLTGHQQEPMRQQQWVRCPARSDSSM